MRRASSMMHLFSVDLEEHFQVSAFDRVLSRNDWAHQPSRVEANTDRMLQLLDDHKATATFFALGWVAERKPRLIRRISDQGHELGSHTWWHRLVYRDDPEDFRDDVRRSKQVLEQISGTPVLGFRAPSFSIVPGTEWAFDILLEEGYQYDSSLFPIRRPGYGYPSALPHPHRITRAGGSLLEVPVATTTMWGWRLPAAGGGYLRQLPLSLMQRALREGAATGSPAMVYIHPWEIDPDQPRLPVGWLTRIRHYRGLGRTLDRLGAILREFRFTSVARWLAGSPPF